MSLGLGPLASTTTDAPGSVTGGSENGFQENCVQRANAGGVLRAVPIGGLFYTAWATSCREQVQQIFETNTLLFDHFVREGEQR